MSRPQQRRRLRVRYGSLRALAGAALSGAIVVSVSLSAIPSAEASAVYVSNPASLVNPFIGTTAGGNTFPGADVPFGMVQWSPDTSNYRPEGGGYSYQQKSILGYSLTHISGPGCQAEGDVPILPTIGAIPQEPSQATEPLRHGQETATPGYYQLDAGGVNTQLTTTDRSGMAVFTYPTDTPFGNLLFKMNKSATGVEASQFTVVNDKEVQGSVTTGYFCFADEAYTVYFDMVFNQPFTSSGTWSRPGNGGYVRFDTAKNPVVEAKVGISYVSAGDAVLNRTVENPGWDFNAVKAAAQKKWNTMLGKVQVGGGTATQQTVFYTALYHSLLEPNLFSDVNGQYMGADKKVHQVAAPQTAQYANYSGWDIYRSEIQLEALLAPQQTSDIVSSMLNIYAQTGQLPKWSEDDNETYIMVGDPADGIIADAYAFGATDFNTGQALAAMETEADVPNNIRPGLAAYESDGYIPVDGTYGCCNFYGQVSTQEEYNTADDAIAQFATALGQTSVAQTFATRAQNWQNVFDPASGFVQPKETSGQFQSGFDPAVTSDSFVEADSYVYTAMIPFDLQGLIAAEGGNTAWVNYLNAMTSSVSDMSPTQIQMGDEPSFNIPWEYDYAGVPSGTERVVREIQDQLYKNNTAGLAGNDDLGAMSSWYVWSALGAYPETPGSATVALGSPLFSNIAIHLDDGATITESAPAAADNAPYVQSLAVNGSPWNGTFLPPSIFTTGGSLSWTLGTAPDPSWGDAAGDAPPSDTTGLLPALGYQSETENGGISVAPGASATLTFGVQSMSNTTQQIDWTATTPPDSGLAMEGSSGVVSVPTEAKVAQSVEIQVPPDATPGQYLVTVALQTASGTALPDLVTPVDVS